MRGNFKSAMTFSALIIGKFPVRTETLIYIKIFKLVEGKFMVRNFWHAILKETIETLTSAFCTGSKQGVNFPIWLHEKAYTNNQADYLDWLWVGCGLLLGGGLGGCFGVPVALGILGRGGGLWSAGVLGAGWGWGLGALLQWDSPLWGCAWALAPAFASGAPLDC